jgi:hypothetical protein
LNENDLAAALEKFAYYPDVINDEEGLILQEYVEAVENVSIQMSVNSDKTISFI